MSRILTLLRTTKVSLESRIFKVERSQFRSASFYRHSLLYSCTNIFQTVSNTHHMPPKSAASKRPNPVVMVDILASSTDTLGDAVNALLLRPTPLHEYELVQVSRHMSALFLRMEEVACLGRMVTVERLLSLLHAALTGCDEALNVALQQCSQSAEVASRLKSILCILGSVDSLPSVVLVGPSLVKLLSCLESLCSAVTVKEGLAALIMDDVIALLERLRTIDPHGEVYQAPRAAVELLLMMVRGSKRNKELPLSWAPVARCLMETPDAYNRLECVELLFRVTRQPAVKPLNEHPMVTKKDFNMIIPRSICEAIARLPHDETLVKAMSLVSRAVSATQQSSSVTFDCISIASGNLRWAAGTVTFTPVFMVVITAAVTDTLTVPYSYLRSVKMNKTDVYFYFDEAPPELAESLTSAAALERSLVVSFSGDDVAALKRSNVRTWILEAREGKARGKRSRPEEGGVVTSVRENLGVTLQPTELFPPKDYTAAPVPGASPQFVPSPVVSRIAETVSGPQDVEVVLQRIRAFMESSREERRRTAHDIVSACVADIQKHVDEQRSLHKEIVKELESDVTHAADELVAKFDASQRDVSETFEAVRQLLDNVRSSVSSAAEQLKLREVDIQTMLETDRLHEQSCLRAAKEGFESALVAAEEAFQSNLLQRSDRLLPQLLSPIQSSNRSDLTVL